MSRARLTFEPTRRVLAGICLVAVSFLGPAAGVASAQSITEYPLPLTERGMQSIVSGPDGALWFTEWRTRRLVRMTTNGEVTEFPAPGLPQLGLNEITVGPSGTLLVLTCTCSVSQIVQMTTGGDELARYSGPSRVS